MNILISICFLIICFILIMLLRNALVFSFRQEILFKNVELYDKLASYDEMMIKFWVWDFKKFIK